MLPGHRKLATCSVSGDGDASLETDVPFPADYSELLEQVSLLFVCSFSYLFIIYYFPSLSFAPFVVKIR